MKRMEPLNRQELLKLLAAARQDSTRDWCMLLLMYSHGLRASEVGSLKGADLNERDWTLSIERLKGSEKTLQVIYPNSNKLLNARKAITEWVALRPHSPYLFPNPQGQKLSRIAVYNAFKKQALASGLAAHEASPHALKHAGHAWPRGRAWGATPSPRPVDRLRWLDIARARHGGPPLGLPWSKRDSDVGR